MPNGGDEENRTPDPLLARQVLSQLSYTPIVTGSVYLFPCEDSLLKEILKIKQCFKEQVRSNQTCSFSKVSATLFIK